MATLALVPLLVFAFMVYLMAIPGLVVSPIAGLLAWWLARRRRLGGGREALAGIAYSVCLFLPWILLMVALKKERLSSSTVNNFYILLHLAWVIGPFISLWISLWIVGANSPVLDSDPRPDYWWVGFVIFWGMLFLWIGSVAMTLKWWSGVDKDVTVECLTSFKFIVPYALACVSLWIISVQMWVWQRIEQPCTGIDATLGACTP